MRQLISTLNVIDVASPCPANWDEMTGDDRVRHCSQCNLDVYNLSEMTESEALDLINQRQGRLCAQFYRRADGTVITRDCPVGLRAIRQKIVRMWAKAVALSGAIFVSGLFGRAARAEGPVGDLPILPPEAVLQVKGDVCITPKISAELIVATKTPAQLVETIRTVKQQVGCTSLGQPDPDDADAMSERDRQTAERWLDDTTRKAPAAGSPEHKLLLRYFQELVKRFPAAQLHVAMPEFAVPPAEVMLGRMVVRPDIPKIELPRVLPE